MKLLLLIIFLFIIKIKCSCIFNNIDYSNLYREEGYSSQNAVNIHGEDVGTYTFYWNICGSASKQCDRDISNACQRNSDRNEQLGLVSKVHWGIDQSSGKTSLTYVSDNVHGCPGSKPRQLTINFICSDESQKNSLVYEESKCKYSVTMYGACGIQLK